MILGASQRAIGLLSVMFAVTAAGAQTADSVAVREFAQQFYRWYAPVVSGTSRGGVDVVLHEKRNLLSEELARALQADRDAQAVSTIGIVGINYDPFLSSQDPCERYDVTSMSRIREVYRVRVVPVCSGRVLSDGGVMAEVARTRTGTWQFVNFSSPDGRYALLEVLSRLAQERHTGDSTLPGWYADPEAHVFAGQYWIFPTYSAPYAEQIFIDAFSSKDLVTWFKWGRVLDISDVKWARRAIWAPSIVEKDGWYYLFFGANDIQSDSQVGGIGVARARQPQGPFKDYLGKPLIDKFHNGAQPIDQMVFKDKDGSYYIVYGGWRHCNIAKLNADFTGFIPFPDGSTFKEITPQGYVEGAFMLLKDGKYYFMWSEGGWTGPNYAVAYAIGSSPFGPFERVGKILQQDSSVATGAGHHSALQSPVSNKWYIVYHRRPLGETDRNHRVVSIDELRFDERGFILPVKITKGGVAADPISARPPAPPSQERQRVSPCSSIPSSPLCRPPESPS